MKLTDLPPIPTTDVPMSWGTEAAPAFLTVRALNMTDLMMVVHDMGPTVASAFNDALKAAQGGALTNERMKDILLDLVRKSPELIARLIAAATDDGTPEGVVAAAKLPASDQMTLLVALGQESLRSEAQLKNLRAFLAERGPALLGTLAGVTGSKNTASAPKMAASSRRGIGASARR